MRQTINIGISANDGTGDPLRNAYDKCNDNFLELYEQGGANITVNNPVTSTETTLDTALADLVGGGGGGAVDSVNGQTGVVSIDLESVLTEGNVSSVPIDINDGAGNSTLIEPGAVTLDNGTKSLTQNVNEFIFGEGVNSLILSRPATLTQLSGIKLKETPNSAVEETLAFLSDIPSSSAYKFVDTTQATYLGAVIGLAETSVAQTTILANTLDVNDFMKMFFKVSKSTTVANVTMRVRINTTNNLAGATQIAILTVGTANTYALMNRNINLAGGNAYAYNVSASLASDILAGNTPGTSFTLNTTNDLYVFFTIQLGNVADSATFQLANISN